MPDLKKITPFCFLFFFATIFLSSCSVIGDIFKAGVWVGILGVVLVAGLIIYLVTKGLGKK
jgi:hypothetical protein